MDTLKIIQEIIHKINNVDVSLITPDADYKEDLGLDSVDVTEVLLDIEKKIGVIIENEDLASLKTIGDLITFINIKTTNNKLQEKSEL